MKSYLSSRKTIFNEITTAVSQDPRIIVCVDNGRFGPNALPIDSYTTWLAVARKVSHASHREALTRNGRYGKIQHIQTPL